MLNSGFPAPELLLFFDIDPEIALSRLKGRSSLEIYEYRDFQVKVREKYRALLGIYRGAGVRAAVIDASKTEQEVSDQVWSELSKMPILK